MICKVYTELLSLKYTKEIINAKESIYIITNELHSSDIKKILLNKCNENVSLTLIINENFKDKSLTNKLKNKGAIVKFINPMNGEDIIIDSPICVIDKNNLLIGSYEIDNFDDEKSIINIFDDSELVTQFYNSLNTLSTMLEGFYNIAF